jgi:hypothetical protein
MKIPILQLYNAVKSGLHRSVSKMIRIFITTTVRTSNLGLFMMFENIVLRRIFRLKKEKLTARSSVFCKLISVV